MNIIQLVTTILIIVAVLTFATNIISGVIKKLIRKESNDFPVPVIVVLVSIILSVLAMITYGLYMSIKIYWYYIVGSVILGFFVSYAAMFGYDNLYGQVMDLIKKVISVIRKKNDL